MSFIMSKLRVGILFGGKSGEHEVSLRSAASVAAALDKTKYDVVPIGITKEGHWLSAADSLQLLPAAGESGGAPRLDGAEAESTAPQASSPDAESAAEAPAPGHTEPEQAGSPSAEAEAAKEN